MSGKAYYEEIINILCKYDVAKGKKDDPNLQRIIKNYEIKDGELYYKSNGLLLKILQSVNEQISAIKTAHHYNSPSQHNDFFMTLHYLQNILNCHWKSMQNDVKFYLKDCSCNNANKIQIDCKPLPIWENVAVEILGPFFMTDDGNEYVAIIVDPTSSWIEASAIKSVDKQELADFIFDVFTKMGFCHCYFIEIEEGMINKTNQILTEKCSALKDCLKQHYISNNQCLDSSLISNANSMEIKHQVVMGKYSSFSTKDDKCEQLYEKDRAYKCKGPFTCIKGQLSYTGNNETNQNVSSVFGPNFVHIMQSYTQNIHNLVESCPLTWDKELNKTLFELRMASNGETDLSPFEIMFKRKPFTNTLITKYYQDGTNGNSSGEINDSAPVPETLEVNNIKTNNIVSNSLSVHKEENVKSVADKSFKEQELSPVSNTKRYSLRTNLKAKGNSRVIERFLRLSSVKRSHPCTENASNEFRESSLQLDSKDKDETVINSNVSELENKNNENAVNDCVEANKTITSSNEDVPLKEIHVTIVAENDLTEKELSLEETVCNQNTPEQAKKEIQNEHKNKVLLNVGKKHITKHGKGRKLEKELPYKCHMCVATYLATPDELQLHLGCHVAGQRFLQCPQCPKKVRNWSHLQRHLISHEELAHLIRIIPENRRKCSFCGKVFSTREGMLRHEHILHRGQDRFECHVCQRKYKERKTFKRHMDLHANVIHKCEHCKYKTKIKRNLIEHSRIHEGRGFQCEICKKVFTKQCILTSHMEIHDTNRHPLMCDQCGMKLANVGSLRQHIRNMHEQPGNFPCEHCDYVGKSKGNLICHIERTHNKPFKCETCTYSCKSESALKRHIDIFHNETERRFACPSCPYRARDPKHLSDHIRFRHNPNALRFPCQFCQMKFKTMTMLRHHLPAHTGQHLYSCQLCGYSAKYRQTLHHHVKAKHPDQRASSIIKGTPCSEIPCPVVSDEPTDLSVGKITNQDCNDYAEEVIIADEQKSNLFMTNIFTDSGKTDAGLTENLVLSTASVEEITMEGNSLTIANNGTIQLQIISGEETDENVGMKIIPTQEQTNKAVELLLLAMDPTQAVTEVVSEETVHTTTE